MSGSRTPGSDNHSSPDSEPQGEGNGTSHRPTRNITVAIQYAFVNGLRVAANGGENEEGAGGANQPLPGAFVLNFADVPESTTPERFNEVIALAADVAMNRLNRRFKRMKGISKEAFEALPLLKTDEIKGETCSICYDDFEDEVEKETATSEYLGELLDSKKRPREDDDVRDLIAKRLRENQQPQESQNDNSGLTSASSDALNQPVGAPPELKSDESISVYKHSPVKLPCGHVFGRQCINQWTKEHNSCPICRADIVDQAGLNQDVADDDTEDNVSFDRIRRLLYGQAVQMGTGQNNTAQRNIANSEGASPTQQEQQPDNNRRNFFVLRPSQNRGNERPDNNSGSAPEALPPLFSRSGLGLIPVTFVNLRPSLTSETNNVRPTNLGERPTETPLSDNASNNNASGIGNTNIQDNDRLMSILDHLFSITSANRPTPTPPAEINNETQSISTTSGPMNTLAEGTDTNNGIQDTQGSSNRSGRTHIFNNLFRFARNLRHSPATQDTGSESQHSNAQLFSTGVASVRNRDGVSTVDFHGEMPTPPNLSDEAHTDSASHTNDVDVQSHPSETPNRTTNSE